MELSSLGVKPRVAIIHNALRYNWYRAVNDRLAIREMKLFGCECVTVDLLKDGWLAKLRTCNVVYVGGGDTRRLLKTMRAGRCGELLFEHLLRCNGIYVGVSAGAIVCGSTIEPADWLGDSTAVEPPTMEGYSLLKMRGVVLPHCNEHVHCTMIAAYQRANLSKSVIKLKNGESKFLVIEHLPFQRT